MLELVSLLIPVVAFFFTSLLLVYYRLNRKWPKERKNGLWGLISNNIIEILIVVMFLSTSVPDWTGLILGALQ